MTAGAAAPELVAILAALGQFVVSERSLRESLQRVAELSARAVYGADGAGVTWVVAGKPTTVTEAGDFVRRIDEIQYRLDEGPCLLARCSPAAVGHGLRGVVAVPLTAHGARLGALNVYSLQSGCSTRSPPARRRSSPTRLHRARQAEAFTKAQSAAVNLGEALTSRRHRHGHRAS